LLRTSNLTSNRGCRLSAYDERYVLLGEPVQRIQRDIAVSVHNDDSGRHVPVARKKALDRPNLRIVGEAIPDEQRARLNSQPEAVSGQD
ncbi:hypothetical protein, partial [uncultured Bradyrhizobium sp.]|uniref:hypothetical protein n=1 Tax=uncultured Bradyrhizobium sp. TaxID=199684 RepID=UPI00260E7E0B